MVVSTSSGEAAAAVEPLRDADALLLVTAELTASAGESESLPQAIRARVQTTKPSLAISLRLAVSATLRMADGTSGFWLTDARLVELVAVLVAESKVMAVTAAALSFGFNHHAFLSCVLCCVNWPGLVDLGFRAQHSDYLREPI